MTKRMSTAELKDLQRPIKDRYRDDAETAQITLEADGALDDDIACSVQTGRAIVKAGLHPGIGGDGTLACSGDMLLQALVACAGTTIRSVATSIGLNVNGTVHAEGDLDWRGTLAVDKEAPVGFTDIRLRFELESDASDEQLETLERLTERYCVVYQTLVGVPIGVRLHGAILTEAGIQAPDVRAFSLISAAGRMAIGLGLLVAPEPALRALGFSDPSAATKAVARIAGVRDFVLGGVTLAALDDRRASARAPPSRTRPRTRETPRPSCWPSARASGTPASAASRRRYPRPSPVYGWLAGSAELAARECRPRSDPASPGGLRHHLWRPLSRGTPFRRLRPARLPRPGACPWQRIVRADGSLAKGERQRRLLEGRGRAVPRAGAWTWTSPGYPGDRTSD